MLEDVQSDRVLFLDIETASIEPSYDKLSPALQTQWDNRIKRQLKPDQTPAEKFLEEAGLHSEFSKIVCVVIGKLSKVEDKYKLGVISLDDADEPKLLARLANYLAKKVPNDVRLVSFNGKEFDVPAICRRMLIHGIPIPYNIDPTDRKPWDFPLIDPMELWRFGDRRHYVKLELLCNLLGIDTPKDDIAGEDVSRVYWNEEGGLKRIVAYCQKDVKALARVFLKMKGDQTVVV